MQVKHPVRANVPKLSKVSAEHLLDCKHLRPIAVYSIWWRIYTSCWAKSSCVREWRRQNLPHQICGGKGDAGAEELAAGLFDSYRKQGFIASLDETQELKFLQFRILLCADTRKVRVVPHSKSVAIPLSPLSAHPPSTENWPLAHLRCMCRLASDEKAAEETKQEILTRFLQSSTPQELFQRMSAVPAWRSPQNKTKRRNEVRQKTWWLPMPWHPVWKFAKFGKVIRDMSSPDRLVLLQRAFGITDPAQVPEVRLAWRNRLQHSGQVFQRL